MAYKRKPPKDEVLLNLTVEGIKKLNKMYTKDLIFKMIAEAQSRRDNFANRMKNSYIDTPKTKKERDEFDNRPE